MAQEPTEQNIESYVAEQRKTGVTDEKISLQLLQNGWTLDHINQVLNPDVPKPDAPVVNNQTSQTGNVGTPIQVENVQYNMRMKPVQSKVGLYIKIASAGLWFTVVFACSFLSSLIQKIAGNGGDLATALVFTLSLTIVTTPIFVIGYKKFLAEQAKNPAVDDDIFFKQTIRKGLWSAIVLGAISAVITLYQLLSTAFLKNGNTSYATGFSALAFTAGFGGIVYFFWRLHAKTQR